MGDRTGTKKNLARLNAAAQRGERVGREKLVHVHYAEGQAEAAVNTLLDKLQRWLLEQPELLALWTQDRRTRRRLAQLVSAELLRIPVREFNETTPPNRALRREIIRTLKRANPEWWADSEAFTGGLEG